MKRTYPVASSENAISSLADLELIDAANRGEDRAFEMLYERYREWVASLAYRFTGDRHDAMDVLQEVFAYVFGKFPGFELRCKMKTFLYPAVRNLSLEKIRKRKRTVSLEEARVDPPGPEMGNGPAEGATLAEMVAALPPGERDVVMLRFAEEMRLSQISEALDIPLGTVKSRLHNALGRLRQRLKR